MSSPVPDDWEVDRLDVEDLLLEGLVFGDAELQDGELVVEKLGLGNK